MIITGIPVHWLVTVGHFATGELILGINAIGTTNSRLGFPEFKSKSVSAEVVVFTDYSILSSLN